MDGANSTPTSTGTWPYQGRLADGAGNPITNTVPMIFRLYDSTDGGATPLWVEQWTGSNSVQVSDGLFNVMLGSLEPIPQSLVTDNGSLWLGITAGTDDEMQPRVQLGSVPFAVQALTVPDGSITTTKFVDENVTTAKIANGAVTQAKLGADISLVPPDGSITNAKLAPGVVQLVQTNTVVSFNTTPGWNLHLGTGERYFRQTITFPVPYSQIPTVSVGLNYYDTSSPTSTYTTLQVYWENVTTTDFVLVFHTYGSTVVNGAGVNWIAVGNQ